MAGVNGDLAVQLLAMLVAFLAGYATGRNLHREGRRSP